VFLMREETTARRRICEIQRNLAADEIEAAGAGRQREWLRFTSTSHMYQKASFAARQPVMGHYRPQKQDDGRAALRPM
jgi:hypothetical protein